MTAACDRDRGDPEDNDFIVDGGNGNPDSGGIPRSGRGGRAADAGPIAGRGGGGGSPAGAGGAAGLPGAGVGGGPGGAGAPAPAIDCSKDNGKCGDPEYVQCIPSPMGGSCVDRDECAVNHGGCDRLTSCFNVFGGPPTCGTCPYGYEGEPGESCTDIDECEENNGGCGDPDHMLCRNFAGSFNCEDIQECMAEDGGCGGEPDQYFCIEQYNAAPMCRPNECYVDNGGCGAVDTARCVDRPEITSFCVGKVASVSAWEPVCLLRADGAVDCLDSDVHGEIYRFANRYTKIASGPNFLCGIEPAGSIHCEAAFSEIHQSEPSGTNFTAIAGGNYHACALRSDGTAACWGEDQDGSVSRVHFESNLSGIAASEYATCVLRTAGTIACFGYPERIDIDDANEDGGTDFTGIFMGPGNICALHMGGTAECWGDNSFGQLTGLNQASSTTFTSLSIGEGTICGLRTDGTVRCWGHDAYGQSTGPNEAGSGIAQVAAGAGRTCLVWTDGTFRCYGTGVEGPNSDPWAHAPTEE